MKVDLTQPTTFSPSVLQFPSSVSHCIATCRNFYPPEDCRAFASSLLVPRKVHAWLQWLARVSHSHRDRQTKLLRMRQGHPPWTSRGEQPWITLELSATSLAEETKHLNYKVNAFARSSQSFGLSSKKSLEVGELRKKRVVSAKTCQNRSESLNVLHGYL